MTAFCASIFTAVHIFSAEETYSLGQPTCLFGSSFTGLLSSGVGAIAMESKRYHLLYFLNELLLEMGGALMLLTILCCTRVQDGQQRSLEHEKRAFRLPAGGRYCGCHSCMLLRSVNDQDGPGEGHTFKVARKSVHWPATGLDHHGSHGSLCDGQRHHDCPPSPQRRWYRGKHDRTCSATYTAKHAQVFQLLTRSTRMSHLSGICRWQRCQR